VWGEPTLMPPPWLQKSGSRESRCLFHTGEKDQFTSEKRRKLARTTPRGGPRGKSGRGVWKKISLASRKEDWSVN